MTSPASDPLADRYGTVPITAKKRRRRTILLWTIGVLGTLGAAWSGWSMATGQPFEVEEYGYKVLGPEQVDVTFYVTKDADVTLSCTLTALNQGYAEVGSRIVTIEPSSGKREIFTAEVRTAELATTGIVDSCEVVSD